jgi:phosphate transport system substrate-binding protein
MRSMWNPEGFEVTQRTSPAERRRLLRRVRIAAASVSGTVAVACASLLMLTPSALAAAAAPRARAASPSYQTISGAGSTWAENAINTWIQDVQQNGITVDYNPDGSSGGRALFASGNENFAASEIPYNVVDGKIADPAPARGYAYMPDVAGGTVFEYNLKIGANRVTNLRLSGQVITDIFTGVIRNWDDSRIKADNPDINLPSLQITPVVRSDGSGATADFTQWMDYMYPSSWKAYCAATGRSPCTATSTYPQDSADPNMVLQDGDTGVSSYVAQGSSNGAIGYTQFSFAIGSNMPVALVENEAGYYTEPTPGHVAVSLLKAQIDQNKSDPLYLTENLDPVFTDTDKRTYELSAYSYLILPTNVGSLWPMTDNQGYTLGAFGSYLLCQGQQQVDNLGYSALPINLVEAGYDQLAKIPGAQVPSATNSFIKGCNNPTFSPDGTNKLADDDPYPAACDKAGPTQCSGATGGAKGSGGASGTGSGASGSIPAGSGSGGSGSGGSSAGGTGGATGSSGNTGTGGTGTSGSTGASGTNAAAVGGGSSCDPNTGECGTSGTAGTGGTTGQSGDPVAVSLASSNDDGVEITLMTLCAAVFLGLCVVPPLAAQASDRRRQRRRAQWSQAADPTEGPGGQW